MALLRRIHIHRDRALIEGRIRSVKAEHTRGPVRLDKADYRLKRPRKLGKGFDRDLYTRMRGLNQAVAQQTANAIIAFAREQGAPTVVFEYLKHFRPKAEAKARRCASGSTAGCTGCW